MQFFQLLFAYISRKIYKHIVRQALFIFKFNKNNCFRSANLLNTALGCIPMSLIFQHAVSCAQSFTQCTKYTILTSLTCHIIIIILVYIEQCRDTKSNSWWCLVAQISFMLCLGERKCNTHGITQKTWLVPRKLLFDIYGPSSSSSTSQSLARVRERRTKSEMPQPGGTHKSIVFPKPMSG